MLSDNRPPGLRGDVRLVDGGLTHDLIHEACAQMFIEKYAVTLEIMRSWWLALCPEDTLTMHALWSAVNSVERSTPSTTFIIPNRLQLQPPLKFRIPCALLSRGMSARTLGRDPKAAALLAKFGGRLSCHKLTAQLHVHVQY